MVWKSLHKHFEYLSFAKRTCLAGDVHVKVTCQHTCSVFVRSPDTQREMGSDTRGWCAGVRGGITGTWRGGGVSQETHPGVGSWEACLGEAMLDGYGKGEEGSLGQGHSQDLRHLLHPLARGPTC